MRLKVNHNYIVVHNEYGEDIKEITILLITKKVIKFREVGEDYDQFETIQDIRDNYIILEEAPYFSYNVIDLANKPATTSSESITHHHESLTPHNEPSYEWVTEKEDD